MMGTKILLTIYFVSIFFVSYATPPIKDIKRGYININGIVAISPIFQDAYPLKNGIAIVEKDNKFGIIDSNEKILVPFNFFSMGILSEGKIAASIDGKKYGYIDINGSWLIPPNYHHASPFRYGLAFVRKPTGKKAFIDTKGNIIINLKYFSQYKDGFYYNPGEMYCFPESLIIKADKDMRIIGMPSCNRVIFQKNYKCGFMNYSGEIVIPAIYDEVDMFSEGLARVKINGKYGIINTANKVIVPCQYDWIAGYSCGLLAVEAEDINGNSSYFYLNRKGKKISNHKYQYASDFGEGYALVKKNEDMYIINLLEKPIGKLKKGIEAVGPFSDGYAVIYVKEKNIGKFNKGNSVFENSSK